MPAPPPLPPRSDFSLLALIHSTARSKAVAHAGDRDHGPATDDNRIAINISHAPAELEVVA
jgi:hypothetical protein